VLRDNKATNRSGKSCIGAQRTCAGTANSLNQIGKVLQTGRVGSCPVEESAPSASALAAAGSRRSRRNTPKIASRSAQTLHARAAVEETAIASGCDSQQWLRTRPRSLLRNVTQSRIVCDDNELSFGSDKAIGLHLAAGGRVPFQFRWAQSEQRQKLRKHQIPLRQQQFQLKEVPRQL
jgi:hypothetical protein